MEWGAVQYQGSSIMPVGDPSEWVEPAYYEAWQNQPTWLMPIYDPRFVYGDIKNWEFFFMQLPGNLLGVDGTGFFSGPSIFDLIEGPSVFDIRTPE